MSPVPDAPLADLCRGADTETVADFAAALHEARGWSVERRSGDRFVATTADGERHVGIVHPADDPLDPGLLAWADAVVAPDGSPVPGNADVDVIDTAALGRQLAYAVDRQTARQLLHEQFRWSPPDPDAEDDATGSTEAAVPAGYGATLLSAALGRSQVVLAAVLVLAVAGGLAVVVAEERGAERVEPGADARTPTPTPPGVPGEEPTSTPAGTTATPTPAPLPDPAPDVDSADMPPGLDPSGDIDRGALVDAHGSILGNTSYRLTLTYRETENGRPTGVHTETIRVENETRYRVDVGRHGTLQAPVPTIADTDVYANGSERFERTDDGVERGVIISYDRYLAGQTRFLAVFLDVRSASVADYRTRNGTTTAYVVTEGNSATLIRDIAGSFDVREDGLVTRAGWSYGFSRQLTGYGNLSASYDVRVTDVGETTIDRPAWIDAGPVVPANATATPAPGNGTDASTPADGNATPTDDASTPASGSTPAPGNTTGR